MRQSCAVCSEPVVSDTAVRSWYHRVGHRLVRTLDGHDAIPAGDPIHECSYPDPACTGQGCGRAAYARYVAKADGHAVPMPGFNPAGV